MVNALKNIKAAARRAKNGQDPLLSAYELSQGERQALMDGIYPDYEVYASQGERALQYTGRQHAGIPPMDLYDVGHMPS